MEIIDVALKDTSYAYMFLELKEHLSSSEYWKGLLLSARKSATADLEFASEIAQNVKNMREAANVVQQVEAVKAAMGARVRMQKHLRFGALHALEVEASAQLQQVAKHIVKSDASGDAGVLLAIDCEWLAGALTSIPAPQSEEGTVAELIVQLKQ